MYLHSIYSSHPITLHSSLHYSIQNDAAKVVLRYHELVGHLHVLVLGVQLVEGLLGAAAGAHSGGLLEVGHDGVHQEDQHLQDQTRCAGA